MLVIPQGLPASVAEFCRLVSAPACRLTGLSSACDGLCTTDLVSRLSSGEAEFFCNLLEEDFMLKLGSLIPHVKQPVVSLRLRLSPSGPLLVEDHYLPSSFVP